MKYDYIAEAYKNMILEMAVPNEGIKAMTFWHGTQDKEKAESILKNGIKVSDIVSRSPFTPFLGSNYVTPHVDYATIYAIGGAVLGHKNMTDRMIKSHGQHGYLFKIHGSQLKDVQPDEDSIGELLTKGGKAPDWLHRLAQKHLSDKSRYDIRVGECSAWARGGKTLVKKMTDQQKLDLIMHHGSHVAHFGVLHPDEAYEIDRNHIEHISKDASNLFDYAKRIK